MKTVYSIVRDRLQPPVQDDEVELFTCALQSPTLRDWLSAQGITVPAQFDLTHNTDGDDPPDLHALGLGWECTKFPPNQDPLSKVHEECGPMGMIVAGFSQTGANIGKIYELSKPFSGYPEPVYVADEITAYRSAFLERVVGGSKSKDVRGNDVLLLDGRKEPHHEFVIGGIRQAIRRNKPRYLKLVLLVGWKPYALGDTGPVPAVTLLYAHDRDAS